MSPRKAVTYFSGEDEYFFSTSHMQPGINDDLFVPITVYLPHRVAPRPGLEHGVVQTVDDLRIILKDKKEIRNPSRKYQPE